MGLAERTIDLAFPEALAFLFRPSRYKVAYGGRGSAKSWGFARALLLLGTQRPMRILCGRELQVSIAESVHQLLEEQISLMGLAPYYGIGKQTIVGWNGTEFLFSGIRNNITKIKSIEGIDIAWLEEAEKISSRSWEVVIPTIRKPGSEIWATFNPDEEGDPTYQRFVAKPPPNAAVVRMNWRENPWFPEELRLEKDYLARVDPDAHAHVWEGELRKSGAAQILRGKVSIEGFEPQPGWDGPYQGADWGFAQDPTTLVRLWINGTDLMIEHEAYGIGVDIDKTPAMFDKVPGARDVTTRADSARPETISYMQRHGYEAMLGVEKWAGSVEDGIAFLRSFERIVVHPRCKHVAEESRLYCYKVDRLSGDVLPIPEDRNNHCIDAIRYALAPLIRCGGRGLLDFYRTQALAAAQKRSAPPPPDQAPGEPLASGPDALIAALGGQH